MDVHVAAKSVPLVLTEHYMYIEFCMCTCAKARVANLAMRRQQLLLVLVRAEGVVKIKLCSVIWAKLNNPSIRSHVQERPHRPTIHGVFACYV
jgi:hypothetical protein